MDNEQVVAVNDEAAATDADAAPKKATRTRRKAVPKAGETLIPETGLAGAAGTPADGAVTASDAGNADAGSADAGTAEAGTADATTPVRRSRSRKKVETADPLPAFAEEVGAPAATADDAGTESAGEPSVVAEAEEKPVRRRRVATR
jgi:ribonuclease E